jgi:hypothetical protein
MTSGAAIRQGFSLARRARTGVWILFFANLGLAVLGAYPIYWGIRAFTGHSAMSDVLATGFSFDWLTDFAVNNPGSLERYARAIALFGLISILVQSVLAGGVLASFREPSFYSPGDFFRDCRRYGWRLVRLTIIGLIGYWIVFRLLNQGLGSLAERWTRQWLDDRPVFWIKLVPSVLTLVGLVFVNLVTDFARVRLVMEEGASAIEAFLASLGFSLTRMRQAIVIYAVPPLCGMALLVVYLLIWPQGRQIANAPSAAQFRQPLALAILFIGQQVIMLVRYWFRVAAWGGEWTFYSASQGTRN